MGRKKIIQEKKNKSLTIYIPINLYQQLQEQKIKNKSQLFNWLLEQHFGIIENGQK